MTKARMVERMDSQLPHSQRREDGDSGIGESDPGAALGGTLQVALP